MLYVCWGSDLFNRPVCVPSSGLLLVLCLGTGLISLLLVPLVTVFLRRHRQAAPTTENQPKTPVSVHNPVSLVPLSPVPVDLCHIHLEFTDDQMSINPSSNRDQTSTHTSDPLGHDPSSGAAYWDSGGMKLVSASHLCLTL